jgi:hypothetical protein
MIFMVILYIEKENEIGGVYDLELHSNYLGCP